MQNPSKLIGSHKLLGHVRDERPYIVNLLEIGGPTSNDTPPAFPHQGLQSGKRRDLVDLDQAMKMDVGPDVLRYCPNLHPSLRILSVLRSQQLPINSLAKLADRLCRFPSWDGPIDIQREVILLLFLAHPVSGFLSQCARIVHL